LNEVELRLWIDAADPLIIKIVESQWDRVVTPVPMGPYPTGRSLPDDQPLQFAFKAVLTNNMIEGILVTFYVPFEEHYSRHIMMVTAQHSTEQRSSRAAEQENRRAAEQQRSGAAEQQSSRAAEQQSSRAAEQQSRRAEEQQCRSAAEPHSSSAAKK
jgi:hypothetical protein